MMLSSFKMFKDAMLRSGSPPIRPPIMRMHAYLASWHCTGRGWEEERGRRRGGEGVVGPLTDRQSMRCKLPRRKNELRRRRRHERSATRVVKGPTHSDHDMGRAARPPIQDSLRLNLSWPSILWRCTWRPGSASNQLNAKHIRGCTKITSPGC